MVSKHDSLRVMRSVAFLMDIVGVLIVSFALLSVHRRQLRERKMDKVVLDSYRWEGHLTIVAIVLFIASFILALTAEILAE